MHWTIWLLAFKRQLLARNSGSFLNITIKIRPTRTKYPIKKNDLNAKKLRRLPKIIIIKGISIAKLSVPVGVTF